MILGHTGHGRQGFISVAFEAAVGSLVTIKISPLRFTIILFVGRLLLVELLHLLVEPILLFAYSLLRRRPWLGQRTL